MKVRNIIMGGVLACAGYFVASGDASKVFNRSGLSEKFNKTFTLVRDKFEKTSGNKESYADAIFGNSSAEQADLLSEGSNISEGATSAAKQIPEAVQKKPVYDTVYVKMKEITDTVCVPSKNKVYIPLDHLIKQGKKIKIK